MSSRIDEIRDLLRDAGAVVCVNEPGESARVEIRFSQLKDAQGVHKAIVEARATAPTETSARCEECGECVKCGHDDGVDVNGWCLHGRPYLANQPDSNQRSICSCKCVFPASTEQAGEQQHSDTATLAAYQQEYERLFNWRDLWNRLSNSKRFKLASQGERIEAKAARANRLIGKLIADYDAAPATPVAQPHPLTEISGLLENHPLRDEYEAALAQSEADAVDGPDNLCLACGEPTKDPYCVECTERYRKMISNEQGKAITATCGHCHRELFKTNGGEWLHNRYGGADQRRCLLEAMPSAATPTTAAVEQPWCDHCSADLNGVKHALCERCYREYADATNTRESLRTAIVDWLAHRCDRAPVCGNCAYCRVAAWVQALEVDAPNNGKSGRI